MTALPYGADGQVFKQLDPRTLYMRSRPNPYVVEIRPAIRGAIATRATAAEMPQPVAVDGVVFNDVATRTLTVRLPDKASGYERLLWQQAWQQQRQAREKGYPTNGARWVWADVPGGTQVAHGLPADGGLMSFHFPPGTAGYTELIGKPGLVAIVTIDRATHHMLTCRFLNREAG